MSHFTVLVIGPDVEGQLAPFNENLPDVENAKWDWYTIGGRWTGAFKLKPGKSGVVGEPGVGGHPPPAGYVDQALKGDIDFEQMRSDAATRARELWNRTRQITGGLSWESWSVIRQRHEPDIEAARVAYREQPAVKLLHESKRREYFWEFDDLALDEEVYVQLRHDGACVLFAFLRDGVWTEQGEMGWFGMASNETPEGDWNKKFNAMLDGLPDDTLLTVVDCHI